MKPTMKKVKAVAKMEDESLMKSNRIQAMLFIVGGILGFMTLSKLVRIPVLIQMLVYTVPLIWFSSHLSLDMRISAEEKGEESAGDIMTSRDAATFPFIASAGLLGIYLALKMLPGYWVNLILSFHICVAGWWSIGETVAICIRLGLGGSGEDGPEHIFNLPWPLSWLIAKQLKIRFTKANITGYIIGFLISFGWLATHAWPLHNLFAIGFSIQAIRLISVGNFKTASALLLGLFIYDIFWVFGTNVMVDVATQFKAPAKILFPIGRTGKHSLLGLGDIVIPGTFTAMTLRFDYALHKETIMGKMPSFQRPLSRTFNKFYFNASMISYAAALLLSGVTMIVYKRAQPALLYLVPALMGGLFVPAVVRGDLRKVLDFTEEKESESEDDGEKSSSSSSASVSSSEGGERKKRK